MEFVIRYVCVCGISRFQFSFIRSFSHMSKFDDGGFFSRVCTKVAHMLNGPTTKVIISILTEIEYVIPFIDDGQLQNVMMKFHGFIS